MTLSYNTNLCLIQEITSGSIAPTVLCSVFNNMSYCFANCPTAFPSEIYREMRLDKLTAGNSFKWKRNIGLAQQYCCEKCHNFHSKIILRVFEANCKLIYGVNLFSKYFEHEGRIVLKYGWRYNKISNWNMQRVCLFQLPINSSVWRRIGSELLAFNIQKQYSTRSLCRCT